MVMTRKLDRLRTGWQDPDRRTSILFILSGVFINASLVLTSGLFLSGYIVYLGGSDLLVGLMNNSVNWGAIAGLFSYLIFERMERRKPFLIFMLLLSRLLVCAIIFLPLVTRSNAVLMTLVTVMVISGNILWGIYSIGYNIWIINSFPKGARSRFVFQRTFYLRIAFTLANLIMGFVLDWSGKSYTGFLIVFLTSLVFSLLDVLSLTGIPEPVNQLEPHRRFSLDRFVQPFQNQPFRRFLVFILLFYIVISLSSSYTSLYLLRYLELDFKLVSFVTVVSNLFMIICTQMWRNAEARLGLKRVFQVSAFIAVLEFLVYCFLTERTLWLLFLAPVFSGIGNSGFNIFVMNYRYDLMPDKNRSLYEGWYGALLGLSMFLGPLIGGLIKDWLPRIENAFFQHSDFQLIYLLSFLLAIPILLGLHVQVDSQPE